MNKYIHTSIKQNTFFFHIIRNISKWLIRAKYISNERNNEHLWNRIHNFNKVYVRRNHKVNIYLLRLMLLIKPAKKLQFILSNVLDIMPNKMMLIKKGEFWLSTYLIVPSTFPWKIIMQSIYWKLLSLKITSEGWVNTNLPTRSNIHFKIYFDHL